MRALGGRVPGPGGSGTGRERRRVWREDRQWNLHKNNNQYIKLPKRLLTIDYLLCYLLK